MLHQIASGLQNATEGYLTLASHVSKIAPYELPQVIAQIPSPPMDVPMPIRKALSIDGESKVVNYLLCGEYEITNTSCLNCRKSITLVKIKYILLLKEKEDPEDPTTSERKNKPLNQNLPGLILTLEPYTMALLMLLGYLVCNVLLAWATLQQPYISKTLSSPPP